MEHYSSKQVLSETIQPVFNGRFPEGYINDVDGWGISEKDVHGKLPDGTYRLLTLDIDFGQRCSLACPHCFRKSEFLNGVTRPPLNFDEMMSLMRQGKRLGLKSVKFLGAGEPFENPEFLRLLEDLRELGIKSAVFTKGYILGSDELTRDRFGVYGIKTVEELITILRDLDVSILLGFNSFRKDIQEAFVWNEEIGQPTNLIQKDFVHLRDNALLNLVNAGFNEYVEGEATRLALIIAPFKPKNIDEVFDIYTWGRRRNMYTLTCPTTYSGKGKTELEREKQEIDFEEYLGKLRNLYVRIYRWNIENGLLTIDQLKREGISLYPGCHPCNQVAGGFYITLKGKVIRCPGRDDESWVITHDIREVDLKKIWINSPNYRLAATDRFNFRCIARDGIFFEKPHEFYSVIERKILEEIGCNAN